MSAREALRPILATGRLARYRLIDVACPAGHRRLDVIRTGSEPVMLFRPAGEGIAIDMEPGDVLEDLSTRRASGRFAYVVWWFKPHGMIEAWCQCGPDMIDLAWVAAQAAEGRRRVTHDQRDGQV